MRDFWIAAFLIVCGLFLAVHCAIATRRELRAGKALGGRFGTYERDSAPIGFWLVMAGNLGAAIMGLFVLLAGLIGMLVYFEVFK